MTIKMEMDERTAEILFDVLCAASHAQAELIFSGDLDEEEKEMLADHNMVTSVVVKGLMDQLGFESVGHGEDEAAH